MIKNIEIENIKNSNLYKEFKNVSIDNFSFNYLNSDFIIDTKFLTKFMRDYDEAESFSTAQELKDYWEKDENFERLKNQDYGKLNMLYTYKIVLNYREAFSELLIKIARDFFENKNIENEYFVEAAEDILKFQTRKFVKINDDWRVQDRIVEKFKFHDLAGHVTLQKGERSRVATLAAKIL